MMKMALCLKPFIVACVSETFALVARCNLRFCRVEWLNENLTSHSSGLPASLPLINVVHYLTARLLGTGSRSIPALCRSTKREKLILEEIEETADALKHRGALVRTLFVIPNTSNYS